MGLESSDCLLTSILADYLNRLIKEISRPGDSHDVARGSRIIAESAAKKEDVLGEIGLFDLLARPDTLHDLFFANDLPRPLDQKKQYLKSLRSHRDQLAIPVQLLLLNFEKIWTELVCFCVHRYHTF
jgi:hypothetical protein